MARQRRRIAPQARRKMIWARDGGILSPSATGVAIDLLANFRTDGGNTLGSTITRTHLTLSCNWDQVTVQSTTNQLFVGVIVDQVQTAQGEVPRPAVEFHADWMYWRAHPVVPEHSALTAAPPGTAETSVLSSWVIDVKSQRRCEELGQTLWVVFDPTFVGPASLEISYSSSVLLKMP